MFGFDLSCLGCIAFLEERQLTRSFHPHRKLSALRFPVDFVCLGSIEHHTPSSQFKEGASTFQDEYPVKRLSRGHGLRTSRSTLPFPAVTLAVKSFLSDSLCEPSNFNHS